MWRVVGKAFHGLWCLVVIWIAIVADIRGDFDGTWVDTAMSLAAILIFIWLVCFAIGVARGEPNP